jgi:hypothetical protein
MVRRQSSGRRSGAHAGAPATVPLLSGREYTHNRQTAIRQFPPPTEALLAVLATLIPELQHGIKRGAEAIFHSVIQIVSSGGSAMGVSLQKGGNVNLSKTTPGLKDITVGLGWDARSTDGAPFDLDASVFMLTEVGGGQFKVRNDNDFVFYNNLKSACGSVEHQGDNLTGQGEGDDEQVRWD